MLRIVVVLALAMAGSWSVLPVVTAAPLGSQLAYADFLKVAPAERDWELASLSPENRSAIMKQHFEQWLDVHRPDLSSHAQALVRQAIDLVSPAMYSAPPTEAEQQRQVLLGQRMACALGDARASTLMRLDRPVQRISQTWGESTREWIEWLVNCAVR